MSINRIQKLLFSEYCDFEDMVLVESPFAQTTRDGNGIRQVNLGLTPTKLVLATDVLPLVKHSSFTYIPGVDPDIETFELVAVYPVECLNLSVFHRRRRQSLKAHFCNNRILYFELGGFEKRQMFWNLWCERVQFLSPEDPGSSHSETSVATSASNSTLYLLSTKKMVTNAGVNQYWCKFGAGDAMTVNSSPKWPDRYLYLGKGLEESALDYTPIVKHPEMSHFIVRPKRLKKSMFADSHSCNGISSKNVSTMDSQIAVNRFGSGVPEGCKSSLYLHPENITLHARPHNQSNTLIETVYNVPSTITTQHPADFIDLTESAVKLWELSGTNSLVIQHTRGRHRRRYGFAPHPHFLHGLGPWSVPPGERYSIQVKRAVSAVGIRRQPADLRLPVSRRQLVASISCEALHLDSRLKASANTIKAALKRPVVFFWTPEYWYRPRSAKDAYQELLNHLNEIRKFCQRTSKRGKKSCRRGLFKSHKSKKQDRDMILTDTDDLSEEFVKTKKTKRNIVRSLFTPLREAVDDISDRENERKPEETSVQFLRRVLKMEISLTAWDFDSTTLACQLTLIDRDLFLKIPSMELGVLLWQQTSKNAPNIGALEAFSHRISCLVATEILRNDSEKMRARLIARLINTAEKCHKLSNFQSCRSVLCGLQSPAVYRLHITWTYVRKRHATKYQVFETLCRLYRDPRLPAYQKSFYKASRERPYLPYMGDLLSRLLNRIPLFYNKCSALPVNNGLQKQVTFLCEERTSSTKTVQHSVPMQTPTARTLKRILSTLRVSPAAQNSNLAKECETYSEDSRMTRLNIAIEHLENCQRAAGGYLLRKNDLARDYLLKARYREDKENFFNSYGIEKQCFTNSGYLCDF